MKADNRVLITKKINNFFNHSQFYHYSPNETDYQFTDIQFSAVCYSCYT